MTPVPVPNPQMPVDDLCETVQPYDLAGAVILEDSYSSHSPSVTRKRTGGRRSTGWAAVDARVSRSLGFVGFCHCFVTRPWERVPGPPCGSFRDRSFRRAQCSILSLVHALSGVRGNSTLVAARGFDDLMGCDQGTSVVVAAMDERPAGSGFRQPRGSLIHASTCPAASRFTGIDRS
jgi:hypothetical protein